MIHILLQHLQHEAFFVGGVEVADVVFQKFIEHGGLHRRNSDDVFDGEDNAYGHSDKVRLVFFLRVFVLDRCVDEDKPDVFVALVAGAFVEVERVGKKDGVKFEATGEVLQFVRCEGRGQVHPTAGIQLGQFDQAAFFACVITDHCPLSVRWLIVVGCRLFVSCATGFSNQ